LIAAKHNSTTWRNIVAHLLVSASRAVSFTGMDLPSAATGFLVKANFLSKTLSPGHRTGKSAANAASPSSAECHQQS
jgi:hypothetical protein